MSILNLEIRLKLDRDVTQSPNLCDRLSEVDRTTIAESIFNGYTRDKASRFKWEKRMEAGMDLAMQVQKAKTFPWPNASNVIFPLVTIASLQFSAQSYGNIIQGTDIVKYRLAGADPDGELKKRADRISSHMSWQVLEEDSAWEVQHDLLLINLGIVGTVFVKTYFSPSLGHNVSDMVPARDLILDYWSKSVEAAARKTHVIPLTRNEIYERCKSGTFIDVLDEQWFSTIPAPIETNPQRDNRLGETPPQPDEDTPFQMLEQHRLLDLDGDGYAEPYICTIEANSKKLLRIVARWEREEDIEWRNDSHTEILRIRPTESFTKYSFIPSPDGGIYDVGFGALLGPVNESVNSGINQLLDAGTMANSNGGFLGRGTKIRGGTFTFTPWEWKPVQSTGDDLRKSLVPFPVREPSNVMFQLLGLLINYADRVAGTVDQNVGVSPGQNTPAETSRNTMEAGMKVYSAIFKRVWRSMKEEFKKLHKLNAVYMPTRQQFGAKSGFALQEDYKSDPDLVCPVADPNITSAGMRFAQAQAVRIAAHEVPGYNVEEVEKQFLRALKIEDIEVIFPGANNVPPLPNPKMQVEEMKLKGKALQLEHEKQKFIATLMEDRRKNDAQISLWQAQALKLVADAKLDQKKHLVEQFEAMIDSLRTHNQMIDDRIKTLNEVSQNDTGQTSGRAGVPQLAPASGDQGSVAAAPAGGGGAQEPMGG